MRLTRVEILRESIKVVVAAIADKSIRVTQAGATAFVEWNKRTLKPVRVNIPYVPDNASDKLIKAVQGFIDHECAHIIFTDAKAVKAADEAGCGMVHNIIEDTYIERSMRDLYEGSRHNLIEVWSFLAEELLKEPLDAAIEADDKAGIISRGLPVAIHAWAGNPAAEEFMESRWDAFKKIKDIIGDDLLEEIPEVDSSWEAVELAVKIKNRMEEWKKEEDRKERERRKKERKEREEAESREEESSDPGDGESEDDGDPDEEDFDPDDYEPGDDEPFDDFNEDDEPPEPAPKSEGDEDDDSPDDSEDEDDSDGGGSDEEDDDSEDDSKGDLIDPPKDEDGDAGEDGEDKGTGDDEPDYESGKDDEAEEEDEEEDLSDYESEADKAMEALEDMKDMDEMSSKLIEEEMAKALETSEYWPLTKDLDQIERYTPECVDSDYVKRRHDEIAGHIGVLQKHLERMISAKSHSRQIPGFRTGKLHGSALYRVATGDDRVFRRKYTMKTKDVDVQLVVDLSGSMTGRKVQLAVECAYALCEALDRLNINNQVVGFTTRDYRGETTKTHTKEAKKAMKNPSRTEPIYMPIMKDWGQRFTADRKAATIMVAQDIELANNIDGESIEYAGRMLWGQPGARKLMIVLSDGMPCAAGDYSEQYNHLKNVIRRFEMAGTEIFGIGIMTDAVEAFYSNYEVVDDLEALSSTVMQTLGRMLLNQR